MIKVLDFKGVHLKYSVEDCDSHVLFIKEHITRNYEEDKPLGRTLFVVNIPPYVDDNSLKKLFSVGEISSIQMIRGIPSKNNEEKKEYFCNGFQTAYIVFQKREGLVRTLNLTTLKPLVDETNEPLMGLAKYAKKYNKSICDHQTLYDEATKIVKAYDDEEEEKRNKEEEVDEEGWTVVKKKSRNPGLALKESVETKLHEKHKNKMKKKQLQNFYSFQIRDSKKKHLAALKEQHEEAKRRIAQMKQTRTFKPY